jgi:outer membrane protein insertion porin family
LNTKKEKEGLERQQNKLTMKIFKFFLVLFIPFFCVIAQDINPSKQYILGDIELSGEHNLSKNSVLKIMNLSIGQKIILPGDELKNSIKSLWNQNIFSDIQVWKVEQNDKVINLEIYLKTLPSLSKFKFSGIKKGEEDDLRKKIELNIGTPVNQNLITNSKQKIKTYFIEKGFSNATCEIQSTTDTIDINKVILHFNILKNERMKIEAINFSGNKNIKTRKLKKRMKNTREKALKYIFSSSKLIKENYEEDLIQVLNFYKENGYRDAIILKDSIYSSSDNKLTIDIEISEGKQYFFGEITWLGNTKYESETLTKILGIQKGDVFDETRLDERLNMSRNGDDVSALYMDDGYLFFQINPIEIAIQDGNLIDLELQITEGKQAMIRNVTIEGNTKTNDHIIMREIRSLPGTLFKRSDIIRTQEEFNRLGFFNPESLGVQPIPDPNTGNVDIHYTVEEKPADQIELQGGWGNGMFVGSFGVSFSNFSTKGIFDKSTWDPLPTGDGQKLRLRAQSNGSYYQNYSISFEEPWLGGKKPNSFSIALWKSIQSFTEGSSMQIIGGSIGLGKRIKWPDDYFSIQSNLNVLRYKLEDYQTSLFDFSDGFSNNINYAISINRNSIFNPIYPRYGSRFSISLELTPPYSLFSNKDYMSMNDQEKFKFLEYKKIKTQGTWFNAIAGDLVLKTHFEFGFLSAYNQELGLPPFERFFVGGDGLSGYSIDGRELIGLRGYPNSSLSANDGAPIYGKYNIEIRYPISLNPNSTIYALCFAEAGNAWSEISEFNPFETKRSLGMGIRIFMPMFGILGVDFGHGFDNIPGYNTKSGWQTHFTIGQQF